MLLNTKVPFSYTFGKIKFEIISILSYSVLVWVLYHNFHFVRIAIPLSVPAMLGTVISLLLGFRSNQAYDRWWEARHIWGAIVNDSRTLARQTITFTDVRPSQEAEMNHFQQRLVNRQVAWAYALGQHLRGNNPLAGMERLLDRRDIEFLADHTNKPAGLLLLHGLDIARAGREGWINEYQQVQIDSTISRLCDAQGKCERIKNTIFPSTYSLYIHFSLLLFIALLPFGLISFFGPLSILMVTAISGSFLLIEKMAIHLQDPFESKPTDTPVTTIAGNIERDLRQMLAEQTNNYNEVTTHARGSYYVM